MSHDVTRFVMTLTAVFAFTTNIFSAETGPKHVRVVWENNPATEASIVWDTYGEDPGGLIYLDTTPHQGDADSYAQKIPQVRSGKYVSFVKKQKPNAPRPKPKPEPDLWYHHVELTDLQADTTYYFMVESRGEKTREYHFLTAPDKDKPIKLIVGGDSRTRIDAARSICRLAARLLTEEPDILALYHGGDYAEAPTISKWIPWLEAYELTTTAEGRMLPIIPLRGNHERDTDFMDCAYNTPGSANNLNFFTTQLTPAIRIVNLNSTSNDQADQKNFLRAELEKLKKDNIRWRLVGYHIPLYPAVKPPNSPFRDIWLGLFDEYRVDVVLESDGHCIKRTAPIKGKKFDPDGTIYLGEGGMGAPQRTPKTDRWYLQGGQGFVSQGDHLMLLSFSQNAIEYRAISPDGTVLDSATFKAKNR